VIDSMTPLERSYPFLMTVPGRCLRIAGGAGVESSRVRDLFSQFKAMSKLLKNLEASRWRNV
jgi:signal recognition particle GTPase